MRRSICCRPGDRLDRPWVVVGEGSSLQLYANYIFNNKYRQLSHKNYHIPIDIKVRYGLSDLPQYFLLQKYMIKRNNVVQYRSIKYSTSLTFLKPNSTHLTPSQHPQHTIHYRNTKENSISFSANIKEQQAQGIKKNNFVISSSNKPKLTLNFDKNNAKNINGLQKNVKKEQEAAEQLFEGLQLNQYNIYCPYEQNFQFLKTKNDSLPQILHTQKRQLQKIKYQMLTFQMQAQKQLFQADFFMQKHLKQLKKMLQTSRHQHNKTIITSRQSIKSLNTFYEHMNQRSSQISAQISQMEARYNA